ncbi:hypothetical protein BJ508DRAFT_346288 [Ascobolus immersus RN42]|uniref:Uncharacterized protein n=1 Tax=Ascobolus immersus RN42 TaxID=1160509 RepID=A0A3N4I4U4_ASCIM|nr:hypothetical protein BJ508DRAFT_346288 [Ascobolus immersus RN42]
MTPTQQDHHDASKRVKESSITEPTKPVASSVPVVKETPTVVHTTVKVVHTSSKADTGNTMASTSKIEVTHAAKSGAGSDEKKVYGFPGFRTQKDKPSTAPNSPKHPPPSNEAAMRSTSSLRRTTSERHPVAPKHSISNLLQKAKDTTSRPGAGKRADSERHSSGWANAFMGKKSPEKGSVGKRDQTLSPSSTTAVAGTPDDQKHGPKQETVSDQKQKPVHEKDPSSPMAANHPLPAQSPLTNNEVPAASSVNGQAKPVGLTSENVQAQPEKAPVSHPADHSLNSRNAENPQKDAQSKDVPVRNDNQRTTSTGAVKENDKQNATSEKRRPHANTTANHPPKETPYGFSGRVVDDSVTSFPISRNASALDLAHGNHTANKHGGDSHVLDAKLKDQKEKAALVAEEAKKRTEKGVKGLASKVKSSMEKLGKAVTDSQKGPEKSEKSAAINGTIVRDFAVESTSKPKNGIEKAAQPSEPNPKSGIQLAIDAAKIGVKAGQLVAEATVGVQAKDVIATAAVLPGTNAHAVAEGLLHGPEANGKSYKSPTIVLHSPGGQDTAKTSPDDNPRNPSLQIQLPDEASLIKVSPYPKLRRRRHAERPADFMKSQINLFSRFLLDFYLSQEHGWNHHYRTRLEFLSNKNKRERICEDLHLTHDQYIRYFGLNDTNRNQTLPSNFAPIFLLAGMAVYNENTSFFRTLWKKIFKQDAKKFCNDGSVLCIFPPSIRNILGPPTPLDDSDWEDQIWDSLETYERKEKPDAIDSDPDFKFDFYPDRV